MAIYRISPTGSDAAAGTLSAPWQTLAKLVTAFSANTFVGGDVIVVDPGITHDPSVSAITFSGKHFGSMVKIVKGGGGLGANPLISGNNAVVGVTISNVTNLQIGDWEIENVAQGVLTEVLSDAVLHGFEIHDVYGIGIGFGAYDPLTNRGRDFTVEHCYVHDTKGDGTTSISAIRTLVRYCHFKNHGIGQASNLVDGVAFHGVKKDFCEVHHTIIENVEGKSGIGANLNGALVTISGITFDFDAAAQTLNRSSGDWNTNFSAGDYFRVSGSENGGENDGRYLIAQIISASKVRVETAVPLATETSYTRGFVVTNHADTTATVQRLDGSRVFSHHNYLKNVSTQGINSLEILSRVVVQDNIIVTPNRWFGHPFVAVTAHFDIGAHSIRLIGGSQWSPKFAVGNLFQLEASANPLLDGLYKIATLSGDTITIVTSAPGLGDPAYKTSIAVTGDVVTTVSYAVPFNTGIGGLVAIDGVMHARNNTIYNMSKAEDPSVLQRMASSISAIVAIEMFDPLDSAFRFRNNISVCLNDSAAHVIWSPDYTGFFDYNCYWPDDLHPTGLGRFHVPTFGPQFFMFSDWSQIHDTHGLVADPLFVGDPSLDPRYAILSPESPCIGVGADLSADPVRPFSDDYFGRPRPAGKWDIGAAQVGLVDLPKFRTNRSGAHMELQVSDSGFIGLRFSVSYEAGNLARSAGVLLYRVFKPADYATVADWRSAEIVEGVVALASDLDPTSTYFVEVLAGRMAARLDGSSEPSNLERFREPEDGDSDFGPSGAFVEIRAVIADSGADVRPIDWSGVVADTFNVLLVGNRAEDGEIAGPVGERLDDGVTRHYAAIVGRVVAADMTTPRRLNLLTTAYDDQRMLALQFPHVFSDGTVVASLADYKAGIGVLSTGEVVARDPHQDDPGSAGAMFGKLTVLRSYEPDPHLVLFALGAADMAEYDASDATWESTATTALAALIVRALTEFDHMPRVIVMLPPVVGPLNAAGEDVVRKVISAAVTSVRSVQHATNIDVGLVDLLVEVALAPQNLAPWSSVPTRAQHAWLARSGGAVDLAVRAAFSHVL